MQKKQDLGGVWQWSRVGEEAVHEGRVPGSILKDMLETGLIEDPFWRENEYETRELFAFDYVYSREFEVEAKDLLRGEAELVFEGLDTLCDVFLNGEQIASTADMHRTYVFAVKEKLKPGRNCIKVLVRSSLQFIRHEDETNDIFYHSTGALPGNAAIRKAHCMFGWDWGPQLIDGGIFRPVYLRFTDIARVAEVRHTQKHQEGRVDVALDVRLHRVQFDCPLWVKAELLDPEGRALDSRVAQLPQADESCHTVFSVTQPRLWWPNGWGEHPLYTVRVELKTASGERLDESRLRIGLRTVGLCTQPDEWGSEFSFVVNGKKIFAMGANFIPMDSLISRVTPQRMRRLVEDCATANFNMLRIWGGGYYQDDAFYDACDEYGILLWHDLMFGCNVYKLDEEGVFEENVVAETRENVRRIRHHASLALWCGNNEMESGWEGWKRLEGHHPRYKRDYLILFERILKDVVQECDGVTPWWPSSPSSGGSFYMPSSPNHGDQHYWDVWHSGKPFTEYRKEHFRFCSEYGFQSFPSMKTIRSFTLPQDRSIFSSVMESHQKNGTANSKIFTYVADYFQYPKNMDAIAYVSQLLQLKAIQYGVEFWRQNRGRCMGSLYWQLNDCWPVASWASVDYYGRWKAMHYGARRFYAPRMASCFEKEELSPELTYYLHNDTLQPYHGRLEVELRDERFRVLHQTQTESDVEPLTAKPVLEVDYTPWLTDESARRHTYAVYRLIVDGAVISTGTTLFVKPKHFELPDVRYRVSVEEKDEQYRIHLSSDGFSYYTELDFDGLDVLFSDNDFDLVSPEGRTIFVPKAAFPSGTTADDVGQMLRIRSVRDSFERGEEA